MNAPLESDELRKALARLAELTGANASASTIAQGTISQSALAEVLRAMNGAWPRAMDGVKFTDASRVTAGEFAQVAARFCSTAARSRGGARGVAVIGGAGAFSTAVAGPVMGWINSTYGAANAVSVGAVLPVALALIFGIVHLVDRARGGYRLARVGA